MNRRLSLIHCWFVLAGALALAASAAAANPAQATAPAGALQVRVIVPPSWRPMLADDISREFVSHIDDVFRRRGYQGEIQEVTLRDEPKPGRSLLTINLTEWRIDHVGNITCTFTANLQTDRTTRPLGIFTESAFRWMSGPGRFGLADAFDNAAEAAIRELYDALAKTDLVPGLRRR